MTFLPRDRNLVVQKKIPVNPRYSAVQPVVDTGSVLRKDSKILSDQQVSRRRGELFKRVRNTRLAQMIETVHASEVVESIYDLGNEGKEEASGIDQESLMRACPSVKSLGAKSVHSLVSSDAKGIVDSRDFLLVDLRSEEDFKRNRILLATNHPGTSISRDLISDLLISFKRKEKGRYLLVYHSDEKKSAYFATLLVEKGWEEVYIADGGFEEFKTSYPELTEGEDRLKN